jgi:hypothetical protein
LFGAAASQAILRMVAPPLADGRRLFVICVTGVIPKEQKKESRPPSGRDFKGGVTPREQVTTALYRTSTPTPAGFATLVDFVGRYCIKVTPPAYGLSALRLSLVPSGSQKSTLVCLLRRIELKKTARTRSALIQRTISSWASLMSLAYK